MYSILHLSKITKFMKNKDKIVVTCRGTTPSNLIRGRFQSLRSDHPGIERSTSRTRNGRPATELFDPTYFKIKFYIWEILAADCYAYWNTPPHHRCIWLRWKGRGGGGVGLPYLSPIIIRIRSCLFHPDFFFLPNFKKNFIAYFPYFQVKHF